VASEGLARAVGCTAPCPTFKKSGNRQARLLDAPYASFRNGKQVVTAFARKGAMYLNQPGWKLGHRCLARAIPPNWVDSFPNSFVVNPLCGCWAPVVRPRRVCPLVSVVDADLRPRDIRAGRRRSSMATRIRDETPARNTSLLCTTGVILDGAGLAGRGPSRWNDAPLG